MKNQKLSFHLLFTSATSFNPRTVYATRTAFILAKLSSHTNWIADYMLKTSTIHLSDTSHDLPFDSVLHVILLPNFKEDLGTLGETLDVLASHECALTSYRICLAMEESEEGCEAKAAMLVRDYRDSFFEIRFTVHPKGIFCSWTYSF